MSLNIKKVIPILIQVILCIVILTVPLYMMYRSGDVSYKPYAGYAIRTSLLIILFYVNYLFLIDKFLFSKHFWTYFFLNILLAITLILFQSILIEGFVRPNFSMEMSEKLPRNDDMMRNKHGGPPNEMRIWGDYVFVILVIGLSVAVKVTTRWYNDSINLEKVKATQLEADLKNLRSQLNPHFLFNTLNNIYSLISIDTHKAQDSVHRLSNLLRYILYDNDHQFVPINKELEFTQNYIDLMKLRLSPKVKLNVVITNEGNTDKIASLLFMTLIENAFKHGINSDGESFIDIKILVEKGKGILCSVENSVNNTNDNIDIENKNSGIGLTNLKRRLELLYPDSYEFTTENRESSFFALLRIDFNKHKTSLE